MNHEIVTYPAIFKALGQDFYVVNFPDVKGAITEGHGLKDTMATAAATLASRLYDKKELPPCSKVEDVELSDDSEFVAAVSADLTQASRERINYQI